MKTESGISTRGLPDAAMVIGASRCRVLSSDQRIFSTRVGAGRGVGLTGGICLGVGFGVGLPGIGFTGGWGEVLAGFELGFHE